MFSVDPRWLPLSTAIGNHRWTLPRHHLLRGDRNDEDVNAHANAASRGNAQDADGEIHIGDETPATRSVKHPPPPPLTVYPPDLYAEIERQEKLRKKRAEDEAANANPGKVLSF